ncbi:serine protease [Bradyrhizobium sp. 41S5]|uniref:trypsin-like serine peptidase n=1 Tax=Bradyrhizobium sp. 41S5 TaxID=1404443 RepID=UPI00156BAE36|nr:serine protease [Bradyrhizobium sp. 41S5]UFX46119.1 serine protease [Bradyrhizobium sp. 41S5]
MQLNLRPSCRSIVILVCALGGATYASDQSQQQDKESLGSPPTAGYEQIERFAKQSPFYRASEPVGEIVVTLKDGSSLPRCTGIVLSEDVVLTARHCFDNVEFAMTEVTFLLDYRTVYSGVPHKMNLKPREVGRAQQDDYMLLSAIDRFDVSKIKIPKIGDDPYPKQDLIIYHHPVGQSLMISLQGCRAAVEPTDGVALLHYCDTDKGSSGAPILDLEYNLVGIHVSGGRRPKEEASTNRGLLISEVSKASPLFREVMARQAGSNRPTVAVAPPTSTKTYVFNDGKKITVADGKWFYSERGGDDLGKNLTPQLGGGASQILWDSTTDSLFEIPKIGGPVRMKHGNDEWLAFGTVSVR